MEQSSSYGRTCRVCLLEHDDEIHAATLSVHDWFHQQVTLGLWGDVEEPMPVEQPDAAKAPPQ